jgi:hypothetical protein
VTHGELLAKIGEPADEGYEYCDIIFNKALRAVVELHKPSSIPDWVPTEEELMCWCAHIYPCPTIQAIEKELVNG